ncbi:alpha/beta hydrolase [Streptomyces sp. NPDC047002]|uniref:alpha/beta hydrolase n=1 Tax=Streptomyces sp. NPDC047002 TaxID=3155475 RepID=UPI00345620BB
MTAAAAERVPASGSGLTWTGLRDLRCGELEAAADGWDLAAHRAGDARERADRQVRLRLAQSQEGAAARAAVGRLRVLSGDFAYAGAECGLVAAALKRLADELRGAQRALREALDEAESLRFTVHADGSVGYPAAEVQGGTLFGEAGAGAGTGLVPGGRAAADAWLPVAGAGQPLRSPNPGAARAREVAEAIGRAVALARAVDARYAAELRALTADRAPGGAPDVAVSAAMRRDAAGDLRRAVPAGAAPAAVKGWWDGLPPALRAAYEEDCPELVGNLDGIPAAVRDRANRTNLDALIGRLAHRRDDASRERLAGLRRIREQLAAGGHPRPYLLGIGNEGNGRAIVSFGNPDTARNVAAYVPGLGTGLDEDFAEGDLKRARDTVLGAEKFDRSVAAIAWLGYDAPQSAGVAGIGAAEAGGSAYDRFMGGLVATNTHDDLHLTAIGHSYGSRTVGAAARLPGGIPGADDIVLVGSPGVGVDRAKDLGVGRDHVFVGAAENDVVTRLPSPRQVEAGALGLVLAGPVAARAAGGLADREGDDLWFGRDPASKAFGARRFAVSDGPALFTDGAVPAHSHYFDRTRDPESADSIARVTAGYGRDVRGEAPR